MADSSTPTSSIGVTSTLTSNAGVVETEAKATIPPGVAESIVPSTSSFVPSVPSNVPPLVIPSLPSSLTAEGSVQNSPDHKRSYDDGQDVTDLYDDHLLNNEEDPFDILTRLEYAPTPPPRHAPEHLRDDTIPTVGAATAALRHLTQHFASSSKSPRHVAELGSVPRSSLIESLLLPSLHDNPTPEPTRVPLHPLPPRTQRQIRARHRAASNKFANGASVFDMNPSSSSSSLPINTMDINGTNEPPVYFRFELDRKQAIAHANEWVPYHLQGDHEWESVRARRIRQSLRSHPDIIRWINVYWSTFHLSQSSIPMKHHQITKEEYTKVHNRITKALWLNFNLPDANRLADHDWTLDTQGSETMRYEQYTQSLFELVDIWTTSLDVEEYLEFLAILYRRITTEQYPDRSFGVDEHDILPRTPPEVRRIEAALIARRREEEERLFQRKQLEEKVQLERRFLRAAAAGESWTEWMDQSMWQWLYGSDAAAVAAAQAMGASIGPDGRIVWPASLRGSRRTSVTGGDGSVPSSSHGRSSSSMNTTGLGSPDRSSSSLAEFINPRLSQRLLASVMSSPTNELSSSTVTDGVDDETRSRQHRDRLHRQARAARRAAKGRDREAAAKAEADEEAEDRARRERHAQRVKEDAEFFALLDEELLKIRSPSSSNRTLASSTTPTNTDGGNSSVEAATLSPPNTEAKGHRRQLTGGHYMNTRKRRPPLNLYGKLEGLVAVVEAAKSHVASGGSTDEPIHDGNDRESQPDAAPTKPSSSIPTTATAAYDPDDSAAELGVGGADLSNYLNSPPIPERLRAPVRPSPWRDLDDIKPIDGVAVDATIQELTSTKPSSSTTTDGTIGTTDEWHDNDPDPLAYFRSPHARTSDQVSGQPPEEDEQLSSSGSEFSDDGEGILLEEAGLSPRSLRRRRRRRRRSSKRSNRARLEGDLANPRRVLQHQHRANYRTRHGLPQLPDIPGVYRPAIDRMQHRRVLKYARVLPAFNMASMVGSKLQQKMKEMEEEQQKEQQHDAQSSPTSHHHDWSADLRRVEHHRTKSTTSNIDPSAIWNQGSTSPTRRQPSTAASLASIERLTHAITRQVHEPLNAKPEASTKSETPPDGIPLAQLLSEMKAAQQPHPPPLDPALAAQRSRLDQMRFPADNTELAAIDGGKHDFSLISGSNVHRPNVRDVGGAHTTNRTHLTLHQIRSMLGWGISNYGGHDGTPPTHGVERLLLVLAGARLNASKVADAERGIAVPPATPSSRMERSLYHLLAHSHTNNIYSFDDSTSHSSSLSTIPTPSHHPAAPIIASLPSLPHSVPSHSSSFHLNGSKSARTLRDSRTIEQSLPFKEEGDDAHHNNNDALNNSQSDGALTTRSVDGLATKQPSPPPPLILPTPSSSQPSLLTISPALRHVSPSTSSTSSPNIGESITQRNHRRRREKLQRHQQILQDNPIQLSSTTPPTVNTVTSNDGSSQENGAWRWKNRQPVPPQSPPKHDEKEKQSSIEVTRSVEAKSTIHNDDTLVIRPPQQSSSTMSLLASTHKQSIPSGLPISSSAPQLPHNSGDSDGNDKQKKQETPEQARRRIIAAIRAATAGNHGGIISAIVHQPSSSLVGSSGSNNQVTATRAYVPRSHASATVHSSNVSSSAAVLLREGSWWHRANAGWRQKQEQRRHAIKMALSHLKHDETDHIKSQQPSNTTILPSSASTQSQSLTNSSSTAATTTVGHRIRKGLTSTTHHHVSTRSLPSLPSLSSPRSYPSSTSSSNNTPRNKRLIASSSSASPLLSNMGIGLTTITI